MARMGLNCTKDIVYELLLEDEKTRNSDSYLYYKVLAKVGKDKGVSIESMSVPVFLLNMAEYGFPCFETVRRTRQKIQQHNPELAGSEEVEAFRTVKELEYKDFARQILV